MRQQKVFKIHILNVGYGIMEFFFSIANTKQPFYYLGLISYFVQKIS